MKTRELRRSDTRRRATDQRDGRDGGVQTFFDQFARALTAGDGKAIGGMFAVPALVLGDKSVQILSERQEIERFFGGAREQYHALGVTDTRAEIHRLEWLSNRIVVADVRWPYLDARGNEKGAEASTYTLRRDDAGELRVQVVVMQGVTG
jgi:hypothetical protein